MDENERKQWEPQLPELYRKQFQGMALGDMEALRWYLNAKLDHLDMQIQEAKSVAHNSHGNGRTRYAPTDWWLRVNRAVKITARQIAMLTDLITKARREEERQAAWHFETVFMKVCRESLETAVYQGFVNQARLELANSEA